MVKASYSPDPKLEGPARDGTVIISKAALPSISLTVTWSL